MVLRQHAVLASVSTGYSPPFGTFPCITHPCATLLTPKGFLVRLACVKHAASVRSEPGSNSPVKLVRSLLERTRISCVNQTTFGCALIESPTSVSAIQLSRSDSPLAMRCRRGSVLTGRRKVRHEGVAVNHFFLSLGKSPKLQRPCVNHNVEACL